MLPLWRNRVCIAISPEHISLVKLGRGLKPKLLAKFDEAIEIAVKQPLWQAVLEKLDLALAKPELQHFEVDIVLSNRLVRYAIIPANDQLKKYTEKEAYARHLLTQTYGAVVSLWSLRIQPGKSNEAKLVSAIDDALLAGLKHVCEKNKLELRSVTPYLMPVFNRYRKLLKTESSWLVINEPGYSLVALLANDAFTSVSGASHGNISELSVILDRENLVSTLAVPCKTVYLHAPVAGILPSKDGYELNRLELEVPEGYPALSEGLYAMAMSGVI